jgi:hypothetical protein
MVNKTLNTLFERPDPNLFESDLGNDSPHRIRDGGTDQMISMFKVPIYRTIRDARTLGNIVDRGGKVTRFEDLYDRVEH